MSFAKIKSVCQSGVMIAPFLTSMLNIQVYAQSNNPSNQTIVSGRHKTASQIIYVDPSIGKDVPGAGISATTPFHTITYALEQAKPGNTIQLAPGNYLLENGEVFPLVIKQGITLKGDESSKGKNVVITGGDRYISPTFARQNVAVLVHNDTTIMGVTITNPNKRGTALWIESTNPIIRASTFTNSNREGIFVTGQAAPRIENNIFTKNSGNGISVTHSATGEIRNNLFHDTGFGLAIGGNSSPLIVDNHISQNKDGLFISDEAHPILRNNLIENNKLDGIAIASCAQVKLELSDGNIFKNNGQYDINNAGAISLVMNSAGLDTSRVNQSRQCS